MKQTFLKKPKVSIVFFKMTLGFFLEKKIIFKEKTSLKNFNPNLFRKGVFIFMILTLMPGCSFIPRYQQPSVSTPAWKTQAPSGNVEMATRWWKGFESRELSHLIHRALAHNNDLQASLQRIEQARADLKIAGASLLPSSSVTASYMSGPKEAFNITGMRDKDMPQFTVDGALSYELDLFGANRARIDAVRHILVGTRYSRDALALVIMGDVAQNYFNILNLKERLQIAQENLKNAQDLLKITKERFGTGTKTALAITQQERLVFNTRAEITILEQKLASAQNVLAVLVGTPPQVFSVSGKSLDEITVPPIAIIQPSELLQRRPDIQSMEARLRAANADIGAARSAFFPSIYLGADLLLAARPSASALTLASSIYAPIFQGGRLKGQVDRVTARQKELVYNYSQTVLLAFREAEDALTQVTLTYQREDAFYQALVKARESYGMALSQYTLSVSDFPSLLDIRHNLLASRDAYITARYETLCARVDLFKAMGGGWKDE